MLPLLDAPTADRFARLALACVGREYPNHPGTLLSSAEDLRPPRQQTPAFFGCFDWHSAVHGHWTLARLLGRFPDEPWSAATQAALQHSLTANHIAAEVRYFCKPNREGFERPYGLAWLLQLAAELREMDAAAPVPVAVLAPLEQLCRDRLAAWLPRLTHPIRSGEHSQTAFAMGLALDWARTAGDATFAATVETHALRFYSSDTVLPVRYEPSGHDFLSPALAEADLLRRVLRPGEFANWLDTALPDLGHLQPVVCPDPSDGKLSHLDGLNLSRAWMLDGIAAALPADYPLTGQILSLCQRHAAAGLAAVTGRHYSGGHWLGSFAVYLLTRRGTTSTPPVNSVV